MESTQTNLQLKKNTSRLTNIIFDFVKDNGYDIFTSDFEMQHDIISKSFYKNYIEDRKETFIEEFKKTNFFEYSLYENIKEEELKDIQRTIYKFKLAIVDILKNDGNIPDGELAKTSPSPPLTRKVGNNKLDIKPTGKDYGLLFR